MKWPKWFPFNKGDIALLLLIIVADFWLGESSWLRCLGIGALMSLARFVGIYL